MDRKAFISYNSAETQGVSYAQKIAELAKSRGYEAFFDQSDIRAGVPWCKELERRIREAQYFWVLIGPGGLGEVQREEIELARAYRKTLVGVLLPGATKPTEDLYLSDRSWVVLQEGTDLRGDEIKVMTDEPVEWDGFHPGSDREATTDSNNPESQRRRRQNAQGIMLLLWKATPGILLSVSLSILLWIWLVVQVSTPWVFALAGIGLLSALWTLLRGLAADKDWVDLVIRNRLPMDPGAEAAPARVVIVAARSHRLWMFPYVECLRSLALDPEMVLVGESEPSTTDYDTMRQAQAVILVWARRGGQRGVQHPAVRMALDWAAEHSHLPFLLVGPERADRPSIGKWEPRISVDDPAKAARRSLVRLLGRASSRAEDWRRRALNLWGLCAWGAGATLPLLVGFGFGVLDQRGCGVTNERDLYALRTKAEETRRTVGLEASRDLVEEQTHYLGDVLASTFPGLPGHTTPSVWGPVHLAEGDCYCEIEGPSQQTASTQRCYVKNRDPDGSNIASCAGSGLVAAWDSSNDARAYGLEGEPRPDVKCKLEATPTFNALVCAPIEPARNDGEWSRGLLCLSEKKGSTLNSWDRRLHRALLHGAQSYAGYPLHELAAVEPGNRASCHAALGVVEATGAEDDASTSESQPVTPGASTSASGSMGPGTPGTPARAIFDWTPDQIHDRSQEVSTAVARRRAHGSSEARRAELEGLEDAIQELLRMQIPSADGFSFWRLDGDGQVCRERADTLCLSAEDSIAGCTVRAGAVVYWEALENDPHKNGRPATAIYRLPRTISEEIQHCVFQEATTVRQVLCVPVFGGGDTDSTRAAACIESKDVNPDWDLDRTRATLLTYAQLGSILIGD